MVFPLLSIKAASGSALLAFPWLFLNKRELCSLAVFAHRTHLQVVIKTSNFGIVVYKASVIGSREAIVSLWWSTSSRAGENVWLSHIIQQQQNNYTVMPLTSQPVSFLFQFQFSLKARIIVIVLAMYLMDSLPNPITKFYPTLASDPKLH